MLVFDCYVYSIYLAYMLCCIVAYVVIDVIFPNVEMLSVTKYFTWPM